MFSALNMSGAPRQGLVPLALRLIRGFSTCDGQGVVLGLRHSSACSSEGFPASAPSSASLLPGSVVGSLVSLLSEREAAGHRDHAVVLELNGAGDLHWVAEAISWLAGHGRRIVLRTDRVLPRGVVEAAREASRQVGLAVVLRIASYDPHVQAALLGPSADAAARLLLGAQHLRAQGLEVAVLVAPLMPVVHLDEDLAALMRNIAAADIRDVSFAIGGWSLVRHRAVAPHLHSGGGAALARAYGVYEVESAMGKRQLDVRRATLLQRQARRIAEDAGLTVGGCGCDAQCRPGTEHAVPFVSLLAPDLFSALTG